MVNYCQSYSLPYYLEWLLATLGEKAAPVITFFERCTDILELLI